MLQQCLAFGANYGENKLVAALSQLDLCVTSKKNEQVQQPDDYMVTDEDIINFLAPPSGGIEHRSAIINDWQGNEVLRRQAQIDMAFQSGIILAIRMPRAVPGNNSQAQFRIGNDRAYMAALRKYHSPRQFDPGSLLGLYTDGIGFPSSKAITIGVRPHESDTLGPYDFFRGHSKQPGVHYIEFTYVGMVRVAVTKDFYRLLQEQHEQYGKKLIPLCCTGGDGDIAIFESDMSDALVFGIAHLEYEPIDLPNNKKGVQVQISHHIYDLAISAIKKQIEQWTERIKLIENDSVAMYHRLGDQDAHISILDRETSLNRSYTSMVNAKVAKFGKAISKCHQILTENMIFLRKMVFALCIIVSIIAVVVARLFWSQSDVNGQAGNISPNIYTLIPPNLPGLPAHYTEAYPQLRSGVMDKLMNNSCVSLEGFAGMGKASFAISVGLDQRMQQYFRGGLVEITCLDMTDQESVLIVLYNEFLPGLVSTNAIQGVVPLTTTLRNSIKFYKNGRILVIANNLINVSHLNTILSVLRC